MPINVLPNLPATEILKKENIFFIDQYRANAQDIRPLKIAILNLMPKKIETETQLLRMLSNTPLQIEIELLQTASHVSKNTPQNHLLAFYKTFDDIKHQKFDGLIITGAPVEHMDFDEVSYWKELKEIMAWSKSNVFSTFYICWAAQAGLYYHYGIDKKALDKKMFGVFPHRLLCENHPLFQGFDTEFFVPHSRHTTIEKSDILANENLKLLSYSDFSGVHIVSDKEQRNFFVTGHSEYDINTLADEYFRDLEKGLSIDIPYNYFEDDDPKKNPVMRWKAHATLLYTNWLNYFVYQKTPYDINKI